MKLGVAAVFLITIFVTILTLWSLHGLLLNWDEVDYANAAKRGVVANMLDRGSLTAAQFIAFARSKAHHQQPALPGSYAEANDPVLLRHYHPPFVFYLQAILGGPTSSERKERLAQLAGAIALLAAIRFLYASLSSKATLAGLSAVAIIGISSCWVLFATISCHGWMAVWTLLACGFVVRWRRHPTLGNAISICITVALAAITLETAAILAVVILLIMAPLGRKRAASAPARMQWKWLVAGSFALGSLVVLLWPASVFGLSIAKTASLYAYRILAVGGREYSDVGAGYREIVLSVAPCLVAGIVAAVLLQRDARVSAVDWRPVALIGASYTLCLAAFAISPTYLMPGLLPIAVLAGIAVDQTRSTAARISVVLLLLISAVAPYRQTNALKSYDAMMREDVRWLASADTRTLLADGGHVFSYYLQRDIPELTVAYGRESLSMRQGGVYVPLTLASIRGHRLLILKQRTGFFGPSAGEQMLRDCPRSERKTFVMYDCQETHQP